MDEASRSEDEPGDEQDDSQPESVPSLPSSSREIRNKAEKQRRDKLNQFINELAMLVPMVSTSAKRLDKTSILRLSATFLRMHQVLLKKNSDTEKLKLPIGWCQSLLEGMDSILVVVTASGKIVFVTHNVETILGHSQTDLLGQSLFNITSPEDHDELKRALKSDSESELPSTSDQNVACKREPERRSFYLRLRQKSVSKSDQPQFELVHVMGHLRVPPPVTPTKKNRAEPPISSEVVMVAMMKPFKEKRVTESSLLEATREEWVSRHLLDGTIVFSDHRISVVSGYMSEEVTGVHGFRYMHQDDVRWVMIALRQMYYRGETYGSSCYRLMSKNGEFIYIRTHGYLELNEDTNSVQSFICINTLVSQDEGESHIAAMKALYTPLVTQGDNLISGIADPKYIQNTQENGNGSALLQPLKVSDPNELKTAIDQILLSNLPSDRIQATVNNPAPDYQCAKAAMVSKTMPPVTVHTSKMGVTNMPTVTKAPPRYTRPSVITRTKEKRDIVDDDATVVKRLRPETSVITIAETSRSVIRAREEFVEDCNLNLREGAYIPTAEPNSPQAMYLASPQGSSLPPQGACYASPDHRVVITAESNDILFSNDLLNMDTIEDRTFINISVPMVETLQVPAGALWESDMSVLEDGVTRRQSQLEDSIQYQGTQIQAIEEDLTSVQFANVGSQIHFTETFSQLKMEHRKQQQILKTLQQDHQNIQNCCKDQVPVCGAQDIGV